jgi:hypothetical protein
VVKAVPYLLPGKVAQRRHPTDEGVPWSVFSGIGVKLNPQTVTHGGDRALEQLGPLGLGFEEALQGVGGRMGLPVLTLQLWNTTRQIST